MNIIGVCENFITKLQETMRRYFYFQFPWQLLMLAIFTQSSFSTLQLPDLGIDWSDKLLHFLVFGILGFLLVRGFRHIDKKSWRENYLFRGVTMAIIFGASDELHQYLVPGRDTSLGDWLADILGILVFAAFYILWLKRKSQKT